MSRSVWSIVQEQGVQRLGELRERLETATPEILPRLQGEIAGIKWMLATPERVAASENARELND